MASFSPPEDICDGSISDLVSNSPSQGALKVSHPSKQSQDYGGTTCSSTQNLFFYPWCSALLGPPSVFSKSSPQVMEAWASPECCVHLFAVTVVTAIVCPQRALSLASFPPLWLESRPSQVTPLLPSLWTLNSPPCCLLHSAGPQPRMAIVPPLLHRITSQAV